MMKLALSGLTIAFREPDGEDEIAIAELAPDRPNAAGIVLLERLARTGADATLEPGLLTLTDFETALCALRCHLLGPEAVSQVHCPACGEQVELRFSFEALAEAARSRPMLGVTAAPGGGEVDGVRFRLPTAADARAFEGRPDAAARLSSACVGDGLDRKLRRRVERAIAHLAPLLSRVVTVACAACGAALRALIHVPSFVAGEIAWGARTVFEDVHVLASAYGWREVDILALTRARRRRYAARARAAA